jgi:hypothetical protein
VICISSKEKDMWWIALAGLIPSLLALAAGEFFLDLQNLCDDWDDWDDRDAPEAIWYSKEGTRIKPDHRAAWCPGARWDNPRKPGGFPSPFSCTPVHIHGDLPFGAL